MAQVRRAAILEADTEAELQTQIAALLAEHPEWQVVRIDTCSHSRCLLQSQVDYLVEEE